MDTDLDADYAERDAVLSDPEPHRQAPVPPRSVNAADCCDYASVIAEFAPTCAQYRASLGRIFANGFE